MNAYEQAMLESFELTGGGCCCPDLYDKEGKNCGSCPWLTDCGEGQAMVSDTV